MSSSQFEEPNLGHMMSKRLILRQQGHNIYCDKYYRSHHYTWNARHLSLCSMFQECYSCNFVVQIYILLVLSAEYRISLTQRGHY
jgi:hypothetical protein